MQFIVEEKIVFAYSTYIKCGKTDMKYINVIDLFFEQIQFVSYDNDVIVTD